jgi:hypothetical protein
MQAIMPALLLCIWQNDKLWIEPDDTRYSWMLFTMIINYNL